MASFLCGHKEVPVPRLSPQNRAVWRAGFLFALSQDKANCKQKRLLGCRRRATADGWRCLGSNDSSLRWAGMPFLNSSMRFAHPRDRCRKRRPRRRGPCGGDKELQIAPAAVCFFYQSVGFRAAITNMSTDDSAGGSGAPASTYRYV